MEEFDPYIPVEHKDVCGVVDYANADGDEEPNWVYVDLGQEIEVTMKHGKKRRVSRVAIAVGVRGCVRGDVYAVNKKGIPVPDDRWRVGEFRAYENGYYSDSNSWGDTAFEKFLRTWMNDDNDQVTVAIEADCI